VEDDIKALADAIYADKVRRARQAPISQKMGWGAELFEDVCKRMTMGIQHQFPNLDASAVDAVLRRRLNRLLNRLRQVQEHGIFQAVQQSA
jgi:hypothetical protein